MSGDHKALDLASALVDLGDLGVAVSVRSSAAEGSVIERSGLLVHLDYLNPVSWRAITRRWISLVPS